MEKERTSIQAIKNGEPVERVKEGDNVLIRIEHGKGKLKNASLWLGKGLVVEVGDLSANSIREVVLPVGEYIGQVVLSLKAGEPHKVQTFQKLIIEPNGMDIEHFNVLVDERMPLLMEAAGVENVLDLIPRGSDIKQEARTTEFHVDELLDNFSENLIKLSIEILDLMTYSSQKVEFKSKDQIRGTVKWNKTMQLRMQKGLAYGTTHICQVNKKTYLTPTNLILFNFHNLILRDATLLLSRFQQRESEKLMWKRIYKMGGEDYDPKVVRNLARLRKAIANHSSLLTDSRYTDLAIQAKQLRRNDYSLIREAEMEARAAKNRSYRPLVALYKNFVSMYKPEYIKTIVIDAKRMEEVYQLWVLYELVRALGLRSVAHSMREYKNPEDTMFLHFQNLESLLTPWTEAKAENTVYVNDQEEQMDRSMIGPNIYLVVDDIDIYVHTLYEEQGKGLSRKNRYQVLGFMDDFDLRFGVVFYPGSKVQFNYDRTKDGLARVLVEVPLAAKVSEELSFLDGISDYLEYVVEAIVDVKKAFDSKDNPSPIVEGFVKEIGDRAKNIGDVAS